MFQSESAIARALSAVRDVTAPDCTTDGDIWHGNRGGDGSKCSCPAENHAAVLPATKAVVIAAMILPLCLSQESSRHASRTDSSEDAEIICILRYIIKFFSFVVYKYCY